MSVKDDAVVLDGTVLTSNNYIKELKQNNDDKVKEYDEEVRSNQSVIWLERSLVGIN